MIISNGMVIRDGLLFPKLRLERIGMVATVSSYRLDCTAIRLSYCSLFPLFMQLSIISCLYYLIQKIVLVLFKSFLMKMFMQSTP